MKILVVGATGVLGREVVARLQARGVSVRAMTHRPESAGALFPTGVEVVGADLCEASSLPAALAGVQRVLAAAHGFMGRGAGRSEAVDDAGHRALIAAAAAAGVERFVYVSALGASASHPIDFFRTKYAIEQALRASGLAHVVLRPSAFMEWHAHAFNGQRLLDKGSAQLLGPGTKPRNFVAAADVAAFAEGALTAEPMPAPLIEIGSPGNFSNNEVAALYARLAGRPLKVGHLPAALAGAIGWLARPLHPGLARVMRMASLPDDAFDESFDSAALAAAYPALPLTRLEDFVRARVVAAGIKPAATVGVAQRL